MADRTIQVDGVQWRARTLPEEALRQEADPWHLVRVRFDPPADATGLLPRQAWLRLEEDVPADDVLDQYRDAELVEAFLSAEELEDHPDSAPTEGTDADPGG